MSKYDLSCENSDEIEEVEVEPIIAKGFDRDVDYKTMKKQLIDKYNERSNELSVLSVEDKSYISKKRILINKLIYLLVAMTQLRNGSRISEACKAMKLFFKECNLIDRVIVKIAKSESIKYKKDTKEQFTTKPRYRKMMFPGNWVKIEIIKDIKLNLQNIPSKRLQQRVLDYLLQNFKCNTHSLRYSFINYMLYDQKKEMTLVAKFVGHVDTSMLVRYTQLKNTEGIFDLDI